MWMNKGYIHHQPFYFPNLYQKKVRNLQLLPFTIGDDASSEWESEKLLPMIVRYVTMEGLEMEFFSMPVLTGGTAADMFYAVYATLSSNDIPYHNLVGLSVDNTDANIGQHSSLRTNLTEQQPKSYELGCPFHIINNTGKK